MKQYVLSILVISLLLLPGAGAAQWELLKSNIIPVSHRAWSLKIAEDNSMWVLSTYDAFPPPAWATPKVHHSNDGGNSWTTADIDFGGGLYGNDIAPIDGQTAFLALNVLGGLSKTTEGGQSWETVASYPYRPFAVHFFDENDGCVLGMDSSSSLIISVTADGGSAWTHIGGANWAEPAGTSLPPQNPPPAPAETFSVRSLYDYAGQSIAFGNKDGSLWISHDKGYNWERITTPLGNLNLVASNVTIKDDSTYMVVSDTEAGTYNSVPTVSFATTDGGQTWIEGSPGVTAGATQYIPGTEGSFVVAGHNNFGSGPFGSALTTNFGETWEYAGSERILAMDFNSSGVGIGACCNNGWLTAKGQIFLWGLINSTRENPALIGQPFDVFPNPAGEQLQVSFAASLLQGSLQLQILRPDGSVFQTYAGIRDAALTIPLEGLAPGIYFARVSDDEGAWVRRFVKR